MKRGNSISKSAMWVLMALLILGLGGFGVTNLGGNITSVGAVGDSEIDVNTYARALRNEVNALQAESGAPVSFAQADAAGIPQQVLSRLVAEAALDNETHEMGISIGDAALRDQIVDIPGFQGLDGSFDREAYAFALQQAGLNEAQFEENVRSEAARTLLQGAVIAGVHAPKGYGDTLLTYIAEARDLTYAELGRGDLAGGLPVPTEDDLSAYHQSHLPDFTTPEVKRITYAWLTPEMIIDDIEVSPEMLHEAYDARIAEFQQPERRLVERLGFADTASAQATLDRINAGETDFDALVSDRGLTLADVDMGDVAKGDLGAAGDVVFSATAGDVVGPVDSDIGPALFRVNAVLQAQNIPFEEAEPLLRDALAGDRASRVIDDQMDNIDDLLAGGATIEELGTETEMVVGTVDWNTTVREGIGGYEAFRAAAATLTADDYPAVISLEDGGIFAMRLESVIEPQIQPLQDVRDAVQTAWTAEALVDALSAQAEATVAALAAGASFADQGLEEKTALGITRQAFQPDTPPNFVQTVFDMEVGDVTLLEGDAKVFILRLDAINAPDSTDVDLERLRTGLADAAASDIAQDLYQALADDIRGRAGITLDQQALNAVHANFQ
ncbi:SurA N-terminal domain-containing protein [Rhodobacteraceae bacterium KMM 6894]|nr:SurA N-terminal domain-containing protein [Rhodobacteraceae bacterium KMM 6894]